MATLKPSVFYFSQTLFSILAHQDENNINNSQQDENVKTFEILNNLNSITNESNTSSSKLVFDNDKAMAASYLLGDIQPEVLKVSIVSCVSYFFKMLHINFHKFWSPG